MKRGANLKKIFKKNCEKEEEDRSRSVSIVLVAFS
jgi:hypothetical protein